MAHILKAAALLSILLSAVCATQITTKARHQSLKEIISTIRHILENQVHHHQNHVPEIFEDVKDRSDSEVFCKAAQVLELLPFYNNLKELHKLRHNLIHMGGQITECEVSELSQVEFKNFLKRLLNFSQKKFRTNGDKNHLTTKSKG
ncbi:interleukin-4-like [Callorhinchus milii]|uniref:interleukin-4-like n=1 Tax=Callorhinchus milii TaxID=7868 RepID=UPI0004574A2D|nr:interleukin-4-like [Callorhinchus milii]|eukprot:gi/632967895/ref/XP_007900233.1/ PREDICTED: interleukin-4-like [Callorhinchus milii]